MIKSKIKEKLLYPFFDILLNGFNYGFHIYTSWYLIKQTYGTLNAYLALISLFMVVGIALQSYSARITAGIDINNSSISIVNPILIMGIPVLMLALLSPLLLPFLKGSYSALVIVCLILLAHALLSCGRGIIQGQGDFFKLNKSFYLEVLIKITLLLILLPRFKSIEVTLITILAGYIVALFHLKLYLNGFKPGSIKISGLKDFFKDKTVLIFIFSQFFIYSYFSVDMILINGLHREIAPIYAVIQKFGMIQFFVGSSLMAVFLPELADNRIDFKEFISRWKKCFYILFAVLFLFQFFYHTLFPFILPYMFGSQYQAAGRWIPYAGVIFALLVVINFFITTLLAKAKGGFNLVLLIGLITISVGIILAKNIIQILIIEGSVFLLVGAVLYMIIIEEIKAVDVKIKKIEKKTILFLSWRDIKAPKMGGAEIYTHEMLSRMNRDNYRILHFSPMFQGAKSQEVIDGITYYREGSVFSVIKKARKFYKTNRDNIDYVVNQCNTHRFFTRFWVEKDKRIFFIHQLTRKIWFYHAPFPFSIIGYILEKPLLRLNKNDLTITVSESTKSDLTGIGFDSSKIEVLPEGLSFIPWDRTMFKEKQPDPTFIYVGRFAEYKGIDATLLAFAKLKKEFPKSKIWIVGKPNRKYVDNKLNPICRKNSLTTSFNGEKADVIYKGFVSEKEKLELMSRAHLLVFPSLREGWGLTISEAAAVGTPSLVYNAPGTRDAVCNGESGYMVEIGDIEGLKNAMAESVTANSSYREIRDRAYEFSKTLHWDRTGESFTEFCNQRL